MKTKPSYKAVIEDMINYAKENSGDEGKSISTSGIRTHCGMTHVDKESFKFIVSEVCRDLGCTVFEYKNSFKIYVRYRFF